jgi:macrolide transport system ATP-binding/permease protein
MLRLVASVNIASLLLVRSESRKREIAIRSALGASPPRLARQFVTEGLFLAAIGGGLGFAIDREGVQLLLKLVPEKVLDGMPYLRELSLNGRVAACGLVLTALAGFSFSLASMSRQRFKQICDGLLHGRPGSANIVWRRLGANLVVIELATAMVLLNGAGLLGKSFYRLLHSDIGMQPDHLASIHIEGQSGKYDKPEEAIALEHQIVDRVQSLPAVTSAGLTTRMPLSDADMTRDFRIVDRPYHGEHNEVMFRYVSSGYMATLKTHLTSGRYFRDDEDSGKPAVAIVNRTLARQYFPSEDPVGKKITFGRDHDPNMLVVGVIDDIQEGQLDAGQRGAIYMPFDQDPRSAFSLIVRTPLSDEALLPTLVGVVHGIDPVLAIYDPATMNQRIHDAPSTYLHRSSAWLVGGFGAMALLLGVIGLYGVIAYLVGQRTQEIGVRMALGADRASVYRLVVVEAVRLIALGIGLGIAGSIPTAWMMRGLLFSVTPFDGVTLASVAALLALLALLASLAPAHRAASVSPAIALRSE